MKKNDFNGEYIELQEILYARENRSLRQQEMLSLYGHPLICLTLNIAGPVKRFPMADKTITEGVEVILASLTAERSVIALLHLISITEDTNVVKRCN